MRPVERLQRRLMPQMMDVAARYGTPVADSEFGAAALRAELRYEALLNAQRDTCRNVTSLVTGRAGRHQRWVRAERAARARLAPRRRHTGARPAVFWHGPDVVRPGRPVVVLLNGWTASGLLWPAVLVTGLAEEFDVIRIDNRGSGYSRMAPSPFTIARMADDVRDVLHAVGARSATLVGLSMGGMIAQETALRHRGLVDRLVLCATRPPAPVGFLPAPSVLREVMQTRRHTETPDAYVRRCWSPIAGPGFGDRHPDAMAELVDRVLERPTPFNAMITQLRAISSWSGAERLTRIDAPTTVLHGAADPLIPVGNGMRLAQMIPDARYVELAGVGHLVPFEAPDAVAASLADR